MSSTINASTTSGLVSSADLSGNLELQNNGTTTLALNGGNVGIGTNSPAQKLEVNGGATAGFMRFASTANATGFDMGVGGIGDPTAYIYNRNNTPLLFATNNTERMRIDSSGNLLVGTNTKLGKLTVTDASGTICTMQSGVTTAVTQIGFANPNGYVGSITTSGSTTAYNTSSDYRLKENIAPMTGALDRIAKLKPVTYSWKVDGSKSEGFIAHELQEIVPEAVTGKKDAVNEDGSIKAQGIDTSFLVATLVAAIQELKAEVDALKGVK